MISPPFSCRFAARFTALIVAVAAAFFLGTAERSNADEIEPEPVTDAPVAEKAPPADPPAPAPSADAKAPASHVHEVNPAPRRSLGEVVKDIWTRDKLTRGLEGAAHRPARPRHRHRPEAVAVRTRGRERRCPEERRVRREDELPGPRRPGEAVGTWEGLSIDLHAMTRFGEDILADTGGLVLPNTELLMPLPGKYSDSDITGLTINQYFSVVRRAPRPRDPRQARRHRCGVPLLPHGQPTDRRAS